MTGDTKPAWYAQGRLGSALAARDSVAPGFPAMRLALAFAVLVSHSFPLTRGPSGGEPLLGFSRGQASLGTIAVCVFFIVSGFLVTQSLLRSHSLFAYAGKRILRIFPALIVVVTLLALVLGPLVTTKTPSEYFLHDSFRDYLANMILVPRFFLPGVFEALPFAGGVNGSLWTLRYEAVCYILLPLALYAGLLGRPLIMAIAAVAASLLGWLAVNYLPPNLAYFDLRPTNLLMFWAYFSAGAAMFVLRDRVPLDGRLAVIAALAGVLALRFGLFHLVFPIVGAYLVVYFAMQSWLAIAFLRGRDYSYGFYLYAFPAQQLVTYAAPGHAVWWFNILAATPLALLCGALSWHLIEKPMLSFRPGLRRIDPMLVRTNKPDIVKNSSFG